MATPLPIGSAAPEVLAVRGQPRVLAFVRGWAPDRAACDELRTIRAHLRGLGAELVVLSDAGVWSFRADDDLDQLGAGSDRIAGDIATVALLYGVPAASDAVFVIDDDGVIRFTHHRATLGANLVPALAAATDALFASPSVTCAGKGGGCGMTRRELVSACLVAGFALTLLRGCKQRESAPAGAAAPAPTGAHEHDIVLEVNGQRRPLRIEPRVSLLDALRDRLGLTGTKKGCDLGQCGACTVLVGEQRVLSCLTLAVMAQDQPITTIEGLARGDQLHAMQAAFVAHDAFQCGYCTPGQIMSAVGLVHEGHADHDADIRELMSGNLCRCGAYPNIVAAIRAARSQS
jgi:xanthine dehydrogenase YagT iron-sulfur-binding subunit